MQVLILVPNQSETEGFLLLFPAAAFLRKLLFTVFHRFFGGGGIGTASQLQNFQQPFCVELLETSLLVFDVEWSLADGAAWLRGAA